MIDRKAVLQDIGHLPTLPAAVARLSQMISDERATAADFEKALRTDPALTANLLRFANSAHFGVSRRVTSVRQAVTLLGMRRLFEVATSASFTGVIPERLPGYGIVASAFWLHCVAVGILAERLGSLAGCRAPDLAFTAGLLHDVGKLIIGTYLAKDESGIADRLDNSGASFIAAERSVLGTDHAEIGGEVAEHWKLPTEIAIVAQWHHDPAHAPSSEQLVALTHAADNLAHMLGFGADFGQMARRVEPQTIDRLGLTVQTLEEVASSAVDDIRELAKLLVDNRG